jgi:hypothetical protein
MIDTPYDIDDDRTGYDKFILLKEFLIHKVLIE